MGNFTFDNLKFSTPDLGQGIYNGVTPLLQEAQQDPLGVFNTLGKVDEKQPKQKKDITKTANTWGKIGAAADLVSSALPQKSELSGTYGNYTQSLDAGYNAIADSAAMFGPAGTIVGGAMKLGSAAGQLANNLGAGTDGLTKTDAILGSSFLSLTPIGLANGIFGSKTMSFTKDEDALAQVGGSYLGADTMANKALSLSNKKIGWLSSGSKKKFNDQIQKAQDVQSKVNWIAGNARDSFDLQNNMTAINSNRREYDLTGGYDYGTAVGKHGMAIKDLYRAKRIISAAKYQKGGKTEFKVINPDIINEVSVELPEYREGGKFNVIPEGALHARKNNMEMEGITKKGIPVISESEGGEIEQQAEIERSEIIFRLEATKKLEELAKDGSDEAAIEAGKLLTHEILHNTIDNTNSLI